MLTDWAECFYDCFSVWNVSYGRHLLVFSTRFFLYSTLVSTLLPHLQKVVHLGHSVQYSFLHLSLHLEVIFTFCRVQGWVITCQDSMIGSIKLPYYNFFAKSLACGFWLLPVDKVLPNGQTGLHQDTMWYDRTFITCHNREISMVWVCVFVLTLQVNYIRCLKCTAILHVVGVVFIKILDYLALRFLAIKAVNWN